MLHASTQKLILKLAELTEAGAIAWKEGDCAPPCSVFESEGYLIEVAADPPAMRLLQADGREIERADAADLAATPWPGGGTFATQVAAMAVRAHRVARGAEAAISRILSSLSAPPQRPMEPEPSPAAPEFETPLAEQPQSAVQASEAALAAAAADVEAIRQTQAPEPPPQSHAAPEQAPAPVAQPEPPARPMKISALLSSAAPAVPAATAVQRPVAKPAAPPSPQPSPPRQDMFGATKSFSRAPQASVSKPASPKVTSGGLVFPRISAVTRQTVRGEAAEEAPKSPPPATPATPQEPPPARQAGPDVYKPWA